MTRLRSVLVLTMATMITGSLGIAGGSAAASTPAKWCWSMDSGNVLGTFTTTGTMPGDGTAAAATYDLTAASVHFSTYPDIESGSTGDGTYSFNSELPYQIVWNGSAVTGFWRNGGALTNGFAILNGAGGSGAIMLFAIGSQVAQTEFMGTTLFNSGVTPDLSPVPASGLCASEPASTPGGTTSTSLPVEIMEQYGRTSADEECLPTYGQSYAMWMNADLGGWVCTRTVQY